MPNSTIAPISDSPTGQAKLRARSNISGFFQIGSSTGTLASARKGAFMRLTESPRSLLKPMVSRTSAVICSICAADSGVALLLPCASATFW